MDIQPPAMDGLTASRRLRQNPATAAIPIIALTALAMKEDEAKAIAAGGGAYIAKPRRYQQLYLAVDTLLTRGKSAAP